MIKYEITENLINDPTLVLARTIAGDLWLEKYVEHLKGVETSGPKSMNSYYYANQNIKSRSAAVGLHQVIFTTLLTRKDQVHDEDKFDKLFFIGLYQKLQEQNITFASLVHCLTNETRGKLHSCQNTNNDSSSNNGLTTVPVISTPNISTSSSNNTTTDVDGSSSIAKKKI